MKPLPLNKNLTRIMLNGNAWLRLIKVKINQRKISETYRVVVWYMPRQRVVFQLILCQCPWDTVYLLEPVFYHIFHFLKENHFEKLWKDNNLKRLYIEMLIKYGPLWIRSQNNVYGKTLWAELAFLLLVSTWLICFPLFHSFLITNK